MRDEEATQALQQAHALVQAELRTLIVETGKAQWAFDIVAEVGFDPNALSQALQTQPGLVAWWGSVEARLARLVAQAKLELERAKARVRRQARRGLHLGRIRVTEQMIEDEVTLDEEVQRVQDLVLRLEEQAKRVKVVLKALEHRKTAIQQVCENQKREWYSVIKER